jgi:hypothetical protein
MMIWTTVEQWRGWNGSTQSVKRYGELRRIRSAPLSWPIDSRYRGEPSSVI